MKRRVRRGSTKHALFATDDEARVWTREQTLLLAMIHRAMFDLGGYCAHGGTAWKVIPDYATDAACWLSSDSEEPFSFKWVCEMLDLDAGRTQAAVYRAACEIGEGAIGRRKYER